MRHLRFVPNLITCLNLLSGCLAVAVAAQGRLEAALGLVALAAVFDFGDGLAARALGAASAIGKELDSLADLVSFGLAPAAMLHFAGGPLSELPGLRYAPFALVAAAALRLAKFNVDDRQTTDFRGLATPANALFFVSLALAERDARLLPPAVTLALVALFALLMVSDLPMFSLKKIKGDKAKMLSAAALLAGSAVAAATLRLYAGVAIVPLYVAISGIKSITNK